MGNGKAPAGIDLDTPEPIDDGTSARIGSPTPGSIGLDAKSRGAKATRASMADRIVSFAQAARRQRRMLRTGQPRAARRGREDRPGLRFDHT